MVSEARHSGNKHDPVAHRRTAFHEIRGTGGPDVEKNAFDAVNTWTFMKMRFNNDFRASSG